MISVLDSVVAVEETVLLSEILVDDFTVVSVDVEQILQLAFCQKDKITAPNIIITDKIPAIVYFKRPSFLFVIHLRKYPSDFH